MPKCNFDRVVSAKANPAKVRSSLVFNQGINPPVLEIFEAFTLETKGDEELSCCNLSTMVCLPNSESLKNDQPLVEAFVPNFLPIS